jgi:hypothetical protein
MPDTQIAKIVEARDYIPSLEVKVSAGDMGEENLLVPVDKNAAISQNHITVALAQKAWDSVAVKLVNNRAATPKELKDLVDAGKAIVEMRAVSYSADRPATLPMLNSTAAAVGQGIGQVMVDAIKQGANDPAGLIDRLARAQQKAEAKVVEVEPAK